MKIETICNKIIFEEVNKHNIDDLYKLEKKYKNVNVSKKEFIKNINFREYETYSMIKDEETNVYYGFFDLIDLNYIDGYIYIKIFMNNLLEDMCSNIICKYLDYLFNIYPIRKIYYEIFSYEIDLAKHLKEIGFKVEVKYKNYKYYDSIYYSKYVLALDRKDFYHSG